MLVDVIGVGDVDVVGDHDSDHVNGVVCWIRNRSRTSLSPRA
jgi:hypothetical protein